MAGLLANDFVKLDSEGGCQEASDESLLDRFLKGEALESEDAFRSLVVRHGAMVLGICRHLLNQEADAEEAFQATFLVLVRKGASIRTRNLLPAFNPRVRQQGDFSVCAE
jgi:Sigma-70 region 2